MISTGVRKTKMKQEKNQGSSETYDIVSAVYFCNRNPCTVIDAVNYQAGKLPLKTYNQPFELYKPKEM